MNPQEMSQWLRRYGPVGPDGEQPIIVRKAQGVWLETEQGERLLDFATGGIAPLGYGHPLVKQLGAELAQVRAGSGVEWPERIFLMHKLAEIVPGGMNRRVMLCDSGREALAQAVALGMKASGKTRVVYLAEVPGESVEFGSDLAAVVVHPFDARLPQAAEFCRKSQALLIDDESFIGLGMSGRMFASEWAEVKPDVYVLGPGLAGGMAFGACITGRSTLRWDHFGTGGSPAGCAVALGFITLLEQGFLETANVLGAYLRDRLDGLAGSGLVDQVLGAGMVLTLRFKQQGRAAGFVAGCRKSGLLLVRVGKQTVGVRPCLVVKKDEIEQAVGIMDKVLSQLNQAG